MDTPAEDSAADTPAAVVVASVADVPAAEAVDSAVVMLVAADLEAVDTPAAADSAVAVVDTWVAAVVVVHTAAVTGNSNQRMHQGTGFGSSLPFLG